MRTGSAGAATLRHVGLVALEATLVATLVWIAAMTLAGAGQSNDLVGAANAGRDPGTVPVKPAVHGATALVSTTNAPDGGWVHVQCAQGSTLVMSTLGPPRSAGPRQGPAGRRDLDVRRRRLPRPGRLVHAGRPLAGRCRDRVPPRADAGVLA